MMMLFRTLALLALLPLAGCGNWNQSIANPSNWFQGRQANAVVPEAIPLPTDPRPLVEQVIAMQVESFPGGVIVRATGLPPTQGYWNAELVPEPQKDAAQLVLGFRILAPTTPYPPNTQRSREVTVAYMITNQQLAGITSIVVQGRANSKSARP